MNSAHPYPDALDMQEKLAKAIEALKKISAIQNQEWGPDWEEIEMAREVADLALKEIGHE